MPAIPVIVFLLAFLVCSFIGRLLLVKAAFQVSPPWGLTVLLVPFGPFIFQRKHREVAFPTRHWRRVSIVLLVLFFLNGGNADSLNTVTDFWKSKTTLASAGDTQFHLAPPATPAPAARPAAKPAVAGVSTPAPTPSKAVAAAVSAMAPAPNVLSPAERIEANRKEFERLAAWYDNLKHERGYLRKGDDAATAAFNASAAKYQTALQLAKTEQAELAKLMAKK
jgi:hypothetical protein